MAEAKSSIVEGSALTGSPGQPVDTGALKASWQTEFPDANTAIISTSLVYAPMNETGVRPDGGAYKQKSAQGGRWSCALTIAGIQNIVDAVATRLAEGSNA